VLHIPILDIDDSSSDEEDHAACCEEEEVPKMRINMIHDAMVRAIGRVETHRDVLTLLVKSPPRYCVAFYLCPGS
jgi:hypothetical protein